MAQAVFEYAPVERGGDCAVGISVFSARDRILREMREDGALAGFSVRVCGALDLLDGGDPVALGEVVFVDCPQADPATLAALCYLDSRAERSGLRLILAASMDSLDAVFGCCSQSAPQILINPSRAERVIAVGREFAGFGGSRLRELSQEDRLTLLRLTEQVGEIAKQLDLLGSHDLPVGANAAGSAFRFESPVQVFRSATEGDRLVRATRPPLPDARLVRRIIQQRQLRARFFDGELFADPAWDMLLDLTAARVEHARVSVTSLCIASGVPPTTALRWITQMCDAGLFCRVDDETDRRRAFIKLTDLAVDAMARYFHDMGKNAAAFAGS